MIETALRQAIHESPFDDLPKLVFADWLDEHCRVVEAMFVRHYVLFGASSFGENGSGGGSGGAYDGSDGSGSVDTGIHSYCESGCGDMVMGAQIMLVQSMNHIDG
jgi:uncharacterized protein (TIGR02996 family)